MNSSLPQTRLTYLRGVLFILVTTVLWGVLPIFLKTALKEFSAGTIAWFRFAFSFILLFVLLSARGSRPYQALMHPPWIALLGGILLSANYYGMTQGIHFSGPSNAAILIQLAPVLLVGVGVFFFRERLTRSQILGVVVAAAGFYLFYIEQRKVTTDTTLYSSANAYIFFAAIVWVGYMVCQKILSSRFKAQVLNLLVYGTAAIALAPLVIWSEFTGVGWQGWTILVFLGVNTLLAYGALAEAVNCIPLTLISILVTLNPLITLAGMLILPGLGADWLDPELITPPGYLGAGVAVAGVVMVVARR